MQMPELNIYKSTLTPQQVDAALKRILEIDIPNIIQKQDLFDMVYPVGSIYMSANNVSPQTFLGGTWQQIQGQFLLAASSSYPAGSTGGESEHTLTRAELPNESINIEVAFSGPSGSAIYTATSSGIVGNPYNSADAGKTKPLGSGKAHNNMPPYLAVYMWKRIA